MEEVIARRLIEAAFKTDEIPGWTIAAQSLGVRITYTWQHKDQNYYTVENFTSWVAIEHAPKNPLLAAIDDLIKQFTGWKP